MIVGGGVGGCSIAYHLAELGWRDIVLVDRAQLTSGSTFHSAGLVGQLRSSVSLTRLPADPAVAVGNEPVAVDGVVLGRVTCGGYGYRSERRSPSPTCRTRTWRPAPRWRSRSSARGSRARSSRSRCTTPTGERVRA